MKLPLSFSFRNCLQSAVGEEGLPDTALHRDAASAARAAFEKRFRSGEIGFPGLPDDQKTTTAVARFADSMRGKLESVLVLGIGGSALGAYALDVAIRGPHPVQVDVKKKRPQLVVLDNVDPGFVAAALAKLDPRKTAICVIAKSGGTAETISTFLIAYEWMAKAIGNRVRSRVVAVTDPTKGDLRAIATQEKFTAFDVPANVGGRFSVFTPVGLLPAALTGLDIRKLLRGARDANAACWSSDFDANPALQSALVHHALDTQRKKKIEVVFSYSSYLWGAAFWYRQLWAESLGKRLDRNGATVHTGQTPVAALGVTDQHSQVQLYMEGPNDKLITFWAVNKPRAEVKIPRLKRFSRFDSAAYLEGKPLSALFNAERQATESALTHAGRPNCRWTLDRVDERSLGCFFQMLEFQTAFAGELYGIDAFDQPGVELAKKLTNGLMGRKGFEGFKAQVR